MQTQLQQAIIEQLGFADQDDAELTETLSDICAHGMDAGFGGFIYYHETMSFAEQHKAAILEMARDMADDLGMDGAYSLISSFGCLGDEYTTDSVADAIHEPDHEDRAQVLNAMAWFAAEEFARHMVERGNA